MGCLWKEKWRNSYIIRSWIDKTCWWEEVGGNQKGTCLLTWAAGWMVSYLLRWESLGEDKVGVRREENLSSFSFQDTALSCFSPTLWLFFLCFFLAPLSRSTEMLAFHVPISLLLILSLVDFIRSQDYWYHLYANCYQLYMFSSTSLQSFQNCTFNCLVDFTPGNSN